MDTIESAPVTESHIVLGYGCNHDCRHCVVQVKRKQAKNNGLEDLSTDEAIDAIQTAINNGASKIVFTGGEPTLRNDLSKLVSFCLSKDCRVQIQTNGSKTDAIKRICLENIRFMDRLEFMIPLHSPVADDNDFICRCKGGLLNALASLEYISSVNGNIIGKIVLTKYTGDLNAIYELYEKNGSKCIIIAYPHCVSFLVEMIRAVDLERQDTIEIFKNFFAIAHKTPVLLQAFPRCFVGDAPGAIIQEEQNDFLSLKIVEHKFRSENGNSWHAYRMLDKRKFKHCNTCTYNDTCEGIWKDYLKAYGD